MRNYRAMITNEDYEKMMKQARARALWDLGDEHPAAAIVAAFLFPGRDEIMLRSEQQEDE
jgi:hypothetical protein